MNYTLSEQVQSGAITFTWTGGTADGNHSYPMTAGDMTIGSHVFDTGLPLVNGAIYTLSVDAIDLAGNAATTVTNANITFDTIAPTVGIDPVTSPTNMTSQTVTGTKEANAAVMVNSPTATAGPVSYPSGTAGTTWTVDLTLMSAGTNTVNATAMDMAGNISAPQIATIVVDQTAPMITMLGTTPVTVEAGTTYTDANATALDNIDGDITGSIVTANTVNTAATGTYTVTYNVTDAAGNAATTVVRTVYVQDTIAPVITMLGTTPVTVEAGTTYTDAGATALDSFEGDLTLSIVPRTSSVSGRWW